MMRVVGKVSVVAIAMLSLTVASSAFAAGQHVLPTGTSLLDGFDGGGGIGPRDFLGTGFEQSQGFGLGSLSNVNGWKCRLQNTAWAPGGVGPLCGGTMDLNTHAAITGGVVGKGNGSAQGVQLAQNLNYAGGQVAGFRSPTITSIQLNTLNFDFRMDDNGGADYYVAPQAPTQGLVTARMYFSWTGYMYAIAYDTFGGTFGAYAVGFWDTNWNTYQMVLGNPGAADASNTIKFYAGPDKAHLTQLCRSDGSADPCTFYPAGNQMEEVILVSDNYQNTGSGSISGQTPYGAAYVDNLSIKPEPGTLAMLGAGLVLALRRRSR